MSFDTVQELNDTIGLLATEISGLKTRLKLAEDVIEVLVEELNDLNAGIRNGTYEADLTQLPETSPTRIRALR